MFSNDRYSIAYDDAGEGEPALLLVPGWCESRNVFGKLAPLLQANRRVMDVDLIGHGESAAGRNDFGTLELADGIMALIESSGASRIIPVLHSHAGFLGLELRRRLGDRIVKLVLLDWIVLDPPQPFLDALAALQDPIRWKSARDQLFAMWLDREDIRDVIAHVQKDMGSFGADMWARAGREITAAYAREGTPLDALKRLEPPLDVLHLYSQPDDARYYRAQESFAAANPWFRVQRLSVPGHFPMLAAPADVARAIESFITPQRPHQSVVSRVDLPALQSQRLYEHTMFRKTTFAQNVKDVSV
jgi:pimeloyl-ACP methyl ester carboxylesterase